MSFASQSIKNGLREFCNNSSNGICSVINNETLMWLLLILLIILYFIFIRPKEKENEIINQKNIETRENELTKKYKH